MDGKRYSRLSVASYLPETLRRTGDGRSSYDLSISHDLHTVAVRTRERENTASIFNLSVTPECGLSYWLTQGVRKITQTFLYRAVDTKYPWRSASDVGVASGGSAL